MTPTLPYILGYNPWTSKPVNVTLFGKRVFAGVIKLRILSWKIILDYPDGP